LRLKLKRQIILVNMSMQAQQSTSAASTSAAAVVEDEEIVDSAMPISKLDVS
jgi:hypothetical protein